MSPIACKCGNTAGPFLPDGRCEDCADADTSKDDE